MPRTAPPAPASDRQHQVLPLTLPPFRERPPWLGGDLQTLRNLLQPPHRLRWPGRGAVALDIPLMDGTGDIMVAMLDQPERSPPDPLPPLAVLLHGVTGRADSQYMLLLSHALTRHGMSVLRVDQRGAGRAMGRCRELYHGGRSEDVRRLLAQLPRHLPAGALAGGVLLVGFSMGGNLVLKWAGEQATTPSAVRAVLAISPPIDLGQASRRLAQPRNRLYERALLRDARVEIRALVDVDPALVAAAEAADSVLAFDDQVSARRTGLADAAALYRAFSCGPWLPRIAIPTVILHAEDDPWIPPRDHHHAAGHAHPCLQVLVTQGGGHVGFHGRGLGGVPYYGIVARRLADALAHGT